MIGAIELTRPGALALLVLPLLVLWFARRAAARPPLDATATLEIWQRSAPEVPRTAARTRIPPAVWLIVIALVLGVIALLDPRARGSRTQRLLLVVVDRSPSMYLRDGAGTRLDHALVLARERIAALGQERVAWIAPPIADDETRAPSALPEAWLAQPRWDVAELDFAAYDRADVLVVTDRAPETPLARAGICASGGAAVPGPIGAEKGRVIAWDGDALVQQDAARAPTWNRSENLPEGIVRLLEAWSKARGIAFERKEPGAGPTDDAVLLVHDFEGTHEHAVQVGRDGWSVDARSGGPLPARDAYGPLEPWLATSTGEVVVARAPGRIFVALHAFDEPRGDPAAFPVSWSQLFDESLALPRGSVSIAERRAAGAPLVRDPASAGTNAADPIGPWAAIAAGCAALFAVAAAWLGRAKDRALP